MGPELLHQVLEVCWEFCLEGYIASIFWMCEREPVRMKCLPGERGAGYPVFGDVQSLADERMSVELGL